MTLPKELDEALKRNPPKRRTPEEFGKICEEMIRVLAEKGHKVKIIPASAKLTDKDVKEMK